ncbi:MaoC family dehydratase [Nocardiopsis sp. RSe5-2]|uniref:MaoC family dehydratase n=1 Tax=Nocardiopsis endophytica TaxID=3018445 RepID=A0ABT4U248_9ACTN|nr:MaoC family dehydratase [Nocardiopsis endophytica]MDA2811023.1 MaoC family dehydratase [Nocardiopsis endophytica]
MRTFADLDALIAAEGEELGSSDWLEIDQDRIDLFADATGDHQWIHVDREKAAQGPFGSTIAHGFLSLSLLAHFGPQVYTLEKAPTMGINYGLNKVRFLQPVKAGSRVRDTVRLTGTRTTDKGVVLTLEHTVEIEGEERPALIAEALVMIVP